MNNHSYKEDKESALSKQEQLNNIKRYCQLLSSNTEYQVGPFYTFFKIPGEAIEDNEACNTTQEYQDRLNQSMSESDAGDRLQVFTTSVNQWKLFVDADSAKFLVYFRVKLENFYKDEEGVYFFQYAVFSLQGETLKFRMEKRYSEFINFAKKLSKEVKARPPVLPKKVMLHNDSTMLERATQLEEWLTEVCNDKVYQCEALFQFINIPKNSLTQVTRLLSMSQTRSVVCRVSDHVSVNAKEENFIVFNIKVQVTDKATKENISQHWVGRRFREFVALHELLKRKFQNYKVKLPDLPSKLSAFSSIDKRQEQLASYFNKLLAFEEILDTLCFRKFINLESH